MSAIVAALGVVAGKRGPVGGTVAGEVRTLTGIKSTGGGNVVGDPDGMAQFRGPPDLELAAVEDDDVIGGRGGRPDGGTCKKRLPRRGLFVIGIDDIAPGQSQGVRQVTQGIAEEIERPGDDAGPIVLAGGEPPTGMMDEPNAEDSPSGQKGRESERAEKGNPPLGGALFPLATLFLAAFLLLAHRSPSSMRMVRLLSAWVRLRESSPAPCRTTPSS